MSQTITVKEFFENSFTKTGETIVVVNEQGNVVATIQPRNEPPVRVPSAFHDIDFGATVDLPFDAAAMIIEQREHERSAKKHGV